MKKLIFLVCLLTHALLTYAQYDKPNWMHSYGTMEGFVVDSQYYTMVTDANLRDQPGLQSKVLSKLPIGTAVIIEKVSTDSFIQRGIKLPWLKVRCNPTGAAPLTGYIWGGFLALASIQTPDVEYEANRGVLYLTGVSAYNETKHEISVQVRIALKGQELAKSEFTTSGDLSYYPEFDLDYHPFAKVKAVLSVNYYYPACGYPSGDNLLFWQENNQLTKVLEVSSVSDGGVFYDSQQYILPGHRGGIAEHVIVVNDAAEFEEKNDDLVMTKQEWKVLIYKWNGSKLLKIRELK